MASPPIGKADPREVASEEQHLLLRSLTWILAHTNPSPTLVGYNEETHGQPIVQAHRNTQHELEMLVPLLGRHYEAISLTPSDGCGSPCFISRSFTPARARSLSHLELDLEQVVQFGRALGIPQYWLDQAEARAAEQLSLGRRGGWGQQQDVFRVEAWEVKPSSWNPAVPPFVHGEYLMHHTAAKLSDDIFLTSIGFSQHCGNVISGIKRLQKVKDGRSVDMSSRSGAHITLATYIYMTSASAMHEKIIRGFQKFGFGQFLTMPIEDVLAKNEKAHGMSFEYYKTTMYRTHVPERDGFLYMLPQQKRAMIIIRQHLEPLDDKCHPHDLAIHGPDSLVNRHRFYDSEGRAKLHTLLTTLFRKLFKSIERLVEIKKNAMVTQVMITRGHGHFAIFKKPMAKLVTCCAQDTSKYFWLLEMLHSHFHHTINAHLTWLARIFNTYPGPLNLSNASNYNTYDEFAFAGRGIHSPGWPSSCVAWINILCEQERSILYFRRSGISAPHRNLESRHFKMVYLGITPAMHQTRMMPIRQCLDRIGFGQDKIDALIQRFIHTGHIAESQQADPHLEFTGCVHAEALQMLMMRMKTLLPKISLTQSQAARLRKKDRKLWKQLVWLPEVGIVDSILTNNTAITLVTNGPSCAGCRMILDYVLEEHLVEGRQEFLHGESCNSWAQFDLPSWTPRSIMDRALEVATKTAFERLDEIIQLEQRQNQRRQCASFEASPAQGDQGFVSDVGKVGSDELDMEHSDVQDTSADVENAEDIFQDHDIEW